MCANRLWCWYSLNKFKCGIVWICSNMMLSNIFIICKVYIFWIDYLKIIYEWNRWVLLDIKFGKWLHKLLYMHDQKSTISATSALKLYKVQFFIKKSTEIQTNTYKHSSKRHGSNSFRHMHAKPPRRAYRKLKRRDIQQNVQCHNQVSNPR